jgi:1A family penicillin-binding protein
MSFHSARSQRLKRVRNRSHVNKLVYFSKFTKLGFIGLAACIVLFFGYFLWISRSLPTPGKLANPDIKDSTKILDSNGTSLYSIYQDYNRTYVKLGDIPKDLQNATIATEDQDFYENSGFSWRGYARVVKDLIIHQRMTGGSTITQQLVKTLLLTSERSATRKMKELILAIQVDKRFSKNEVLEMYLNNIPYGGTAVGIEAAANQYFGKKAKDLTLSESVFLAGLPQSPTYYSPYSGEKAYIDRATQVLARMEEEGHISSKESEKTLNEIKKFTFDEEGGDFKAPHFVMYIREQLNELVGETAVLTGNLTVKTTLDYDVQEFAEKTLKEEIEKLEDYKVSNGSVVVLDPKTGGITAMVGSTDYFDSENDGNFNTAIAQRQPGSSLKPLIYAVALEKGYTPASLLMDVPTEFPGESAEKPYKPVNYDGKYRGPLQMRFALGNSMNVPAVKMLAMVGLRPVMQKAYDAGIENWKPTQEAMNNVGLSLVLGGREATLLQISSLYSAFANKGVQHEPFGILEVTDAKGKVIYKHDADKGNKLFTEEVSFLMSHMLLDNNARSIVFGARSLLNVGNKTVAVKTGTTDQKRDNWTVGYTPSYVVGVWVGNNDNTPMNPAIASGVTGASPIWNKVMAYALKDQKDEQFEVPKNVQAIEVDTLGGGLPVDGQAKRTEYFIKGSEPTTQSPIYKEIKVAKSDNNRLANDEEIGKGEYDVKEYIVFEEKDPVSSDGKNRWQDAINVWLSGNYKDDPKYHPPTNATANSDNSDSQVAGTATSPTPSE